MDDEAGLLPNKPPAVEAEVGAAVVAALPEVVDAVDLAPPKAEKSPPVGAAAGVEDCAAEDVVPPMEGKRDFCGVAFVVVGAPKED